MATIEFTPGTTEVPSNVRLKRSKTGNRGAAVFEFEEPVAQEFLGMTMADEEGEMITREVRVKFADGKFKFIEAIYEMRSPEEWERFMRFMERFSAANNLAKK